MNPSLLRSQAVGILGSLSLLATVPALGDSQVPLPPGTKVVTVAPMTEAQLAVPSVKVAAVQITGTWRWPDAFTDDVDPADAVVDYIERASKDGVQLIAFPELYLGKFKIPSPGTDKIAAAAAKHRMYVVVGCFEVVDDHDTFYNTSLIFGRDGAIVGRYHKTHMAVGEGPYLWPPRPDDPEWLMKEGDDFPVFDLDFGRVGILTCYDGYFPEPYRILSLKGAEILIWMNARQGAVEDYMVRTAMRQDTVHVIATNKDIGAGTMIAAWPNTIVRQTTEPKEEYIVGELPMMNLRNARKNDRQFKQRRPWVYGELANHYETWRAYDDLAPLPGAPPEVIHLEPVVEGHRLARTEGLPAGKDLYRLSFRASQPWMRGSIELRMPETLSSDKGFHFLDHYLPDLAPLNEPDPFPQWTRNPITNELSYTCDLKEGLAFGARVYPRREDIELEFTVTNNTGGPLEFVETNMCLDLKGSPLFAAPFETANLYAHFDGESRSLSTTTPTSADKGGRSPWLMIRTASGKDDWSYGEDSPTWWLVDQVADMNLMASVSHDGKYLVGYMWTREAQSLMTNTGNPCLHTGPGRSPLLEAGASYTWHGRIYLMENDLDKLVQRYRDDLKRLAGS